GDMDDKLVDELIARSGVSVTKSMNLARLGADIRIVDQALGAVRGIPDNKVFVQGKELEDAKANLRAINSNFGEGAKGAYLMWQDPVVASKIHVLVGTQERSIDLVAEAESIMKEGGVEAFKKKYTLDKPVESFKASLETFSKSIQEIEGFEA